MDPRQARSRARLHEAVLALATEKPLADISMTEVARAAGVHRSTVYEHGGSPVELLQSALGDELDEIRSWLPAPGAAPGEVTAAVTRMARGVAEHVARHAAIYRAGLGDDESDFGLHGMLSRHFRESGRIMREVSGVDVDLDVPGHDHAVVADAAARFVADGTVGVIKGWIGRPELSVDEFLEIFVRLLPPWWPRHLAQAAEAQATSPSQPAAR